MVRRGLAVVAGDDRRYLAAPGSAGRCPVRADGPLPASLEEWMEAANADADVHAEAACEVSQWLAGHASPRAATTQLLTGLRSGEDVADLVR